jgi:hypothetical protein
MNARWWVIHQNALCVVVCFLSLLISSCAPTAYLLTPPENYNGPTAGRPVIQKGEYWIYESGNLTKGKSATVSPNIGFPLWIGKRWSYEGSAVPFGQPATSPSRISTTMTCDVVAFKQITVTAGTFGAFECQCECTHSTPYYEPGCGQWTLWYAPDVKNVIRSKTESTATSVELLEYKLSPQSGKVPPERTSEKGVK